MEVFTGLVFIAVGIAFYFVPFIIANRREHPNQFAIFVICFFLGWTLLGWVGALVWSVMAIPAQKSATAQNNSYVNRSQYLDYLERKMQDETKEREQLSR